MEWIADDGFAIAMGGPYAYGSVNIDVRVRLTGSEWADGQVRGMRIYDLYTGEEVMRGKAGSCRLQPGSTRSITGQPSGAKTAPSSAATAPRISR